METKKVTNPVIIKRYFSGEAQPGWYSKDFRVDPDYILVFCGRMKFCKENSERAVMWRNREGKFFRHTASPFSPEYPLLKKYAPEDFDCITVSRGKEITLLCMAMLKISVASSSDIPQSEVDKCVDRINELFPLCEEEKLFETLNKTTNIFSKSTLFHPDYDKDYSGVNEYMAAFIMERRFSL